MRKFYQLHLENHCNHKIIFDDCFVKDSFLFDDDIGVNKYFLRLNELCDLYPEIVIDNVPLIFPDKSIEKYDNIVCEE